MNKFLILVAGYPGTGKSYLCNMILKKYSNFSILSPDTIKEMFWDKYGFKNISEKNMLIDKAWQYYYLELEKSFSENKNIICDYPFSDKQKDKLKLLTEKYEYNIITIRMTADLEILFNRQKMRDLDSSRHLGHILNSYNPKEKIQDRNTAEGLLSYKEFINRCLTRGYDKFSLGKLLTIDVSDFSTADYKGLMNKLDILLKAKII